MNFHSGSITELLENWHILPLVKDQTVLKFAVRCAHDARVTLLTCDKVTPPMVEIAIGTWFNSKTSITYYRRDLPELPPHRLESSVSLACWSRFFKHTVYAFFLIWIHFGLDTRDILCICKTEDWCAGIINQSEWTGDNTVRGVSVDVSSLPYLVQRWRHRGWQREHHWRREYNDAHLENPHMSKERTGSWLPGAVHSFCIYHWLQSLQLEIWLLR